MAATMHPYFPLDLHLPGYVPLQVDFVYILGIFAIAVLAVFGLTWRLSSATLLPARLPPASPAQPPPAQRAANCTLHRAGCASETPRATSPALPQAGRHKQLTTQERVLAGWFMVTGAIHFVIEGWVVAKADFFKDASGNYLSDTCASTKAPVELRAPRWTIAATVPAPSLLAHLCHHSSTSPHPAPLLPPLCREGVQQGRQPLCQP